MRGRWVHDWQYSDLRNMARFVRNYRQIGNDDTITSAKLCYAVKLHSKDGEPVEFVVPALVKLFARPW